MSKWNITFLLCAGILIAIGIYIVLPSAVQAPTTSDQGNAAEKADLILATSPAPGSKISSPFTVLGEARGSWYFEASFPYELRSADGTMLAQGPVPARGDWMTTDFVPFSVSINFPAQPKGSHGTLLLKKDNPSGDPARDESLIIPVQF
jgi:hypothetical protein